MNAFAKVTCALALLSPLPAQEWNLNVYGAVVPVGWIDGRPAFAVFHQGGGGDIFDLLDPNGRHELALYIHDFLAIDTRACAQGETARVWRNYYGPGPGPQAVVINGMAFTGFKGWYTERMVWKDPMHNSTGINGIGIFVGTWVTTRDWPCRGGWPEASIVLFSLELVR
jgi:hypothetical protein